MDMTNDIFNLSTVRKLDLASLLKAYHHEPVAKKKNNSDWWYLSPLRNERTASFHVDLIKNEWYDFGLMAGGNTVDFLLRYWDCPVNEMLHRINISFSPHQHYLFKPQRFADMVVAEQKLLVENVRPLYAYPLKNYLHERSIPVAVADQFCKEITYSVNGRTYYGIGFKNDAGGWEIRNKYFKQSSSPKDITCLASANRVAHVFEGFMDFLSHRALNPYEDPHSVDYVVLNGAGLFDRAIPFLLQHDAVNLWLDRDVTGRAYTKYALSLGTQFKDRSDLYVGFKDINEWHQCKGEVRKPALRLGNGLKTSG